MGLQLGPEGKQLLWIEVGPEDALPQQPAACGETWEHCSIPTLAELVWVLAALQGVAQPRSGQVLSQTNPFTDQAAVCWGAATIHAASRASWRCPVRMQVLTALGASLVLIPPDESALSARCSTRMAGGSSWCSACRSSRLQARCLA